jgi:hypothetical protein
MKYFVRTVEDCTPKMYKFKTKKEMNKFLKKFNKKNDDFWVDLIFKGKLISKDEYYD